MKIQGVLFCVVAAMLYLSAGEASAQATRTWVSGVGDDVNPCSRTAPCKTFAGAISKTAASGIISVLDPGGFGTVTITKSITIDGGGTEGSTLASSVNGFVVNGAGITVRLRNLTIEGAPTSFPGQNGVRFINGETLLLDNVRIHDFVTGVSFAPSGAARLVINDSIIDNSSGVGVLVKPGAAGFARVSLENTKLNNNATGMQVEDRSVVSMRNSFASHNGTNGIIAFSAADPIEVTIDNCQITNNGLESASGSGVRSHGALASVVISENLISGNPRGLLASSGGDIFSFGSNRVVSNTMDGTATGTLTTR